MSIFSFLSAYFFSFIALFPALYPNSTKSLPAFPFFSLKQDLDFYHSFNLSLLTSPSYFFHSTLPAWMSMVTA